MSKDYKVLLVSATALEIPPTLLALLDDKNNEHSVLVTGVGKVNAITSLAKFIMSLEDDSVLENLIVLNIGTCGSPVYPVCQVLTPSSITNGGSTLVKDKITLLSDRLQPKVQKANLYTSDIFISKKDMDQDEYYALTSKYDIFDMEGAALALFCNRLDIKFAALKVVSDNLDGTPKSWESLVAATHAPLQSAILSYLLHVPEEDGFYDIRDIVYRLDNK